MKKDSNDFIRQCTELADHYRITGKKDFHLKDIDPRDTGPMDPEDKDKSAKLLERGVATLAEYQERLYAQDQWSILLIFQAMDAAGKDGAIKHVMSGINPQGCQVSSFGLPSAEDLDHDYLWRCSTRLPERGRIGIFNRSYYEEVLVVRVHPEILQKQKLPPKLITDQIWDERFEDIRHLERHLTRNGTIVRKFFLHLSKKEQKKRFLDRLDEPSKNWKFSTGDLKERESWDAYQSAYEEAIRHTSTEESPWFVVPADRKWFTRMVVAAAIIDALASLDLHYPKIDEAKKAELVLARERLEG